MDAQGRLVVPAMGYSSRAVSHVIMAITRIIAARHPWQTCVGAPLIPAGCIGISTGHNFFNECGGGAEGCMRLFVFL